MDDFQNNYAEGGGGARKKRMHPLLFHLYKILQNAN